MKRTFKIGFVLLVFLFPLAARPCPVCLEALDPENPRLLELISRIEELGESSIPELRALAGDPEGETALRTAAARHLGVFQDRDSIPMLRGIVLEILNPEATVSFGEGSPTSSLRDAAADALGAMGDQGPADLIWAGWDSLPVNRRIEIPRLLSQLRDHRAQERQIEILRNASSDSLAFQTVVELRRAGTAAAVPALEERLEKWRSAAAAEEDAYFRRDFDRMIRYTEGTIRVLRSR